MDSWDEAKGVPFMLHKFLQMSFIISGLSCFFSSFLDASEELYMWQFELQRTNQQSLYENLQDSQVEALNQRLKNHWGRPGGGDDFLRGVTRVGSVAAEYVEYMPTTIMLTMKKKRNQIPQLFEEQMEKFRKLPRLVSAIHEDIVREREFIIREPTEVDPLTRQPEDYDEEGKCCCCF